MTAPTDADQRLREMCRIARVPVAPTYQPSELQRILCISARSINRLHTSKKLPYYLLLGSATARPRRYTDWLALTALVADDQETPTPDARLTAMCGIAGIGIKSSFHAQDITKILRIHYRTVNKLMQDGTLKSFRVNNHRRADWLSLTNLIAN